MSEQNPPTPITHQAPPEIAALVERFTGQRAAYRAGKYNETQLRRDFLDPLFEALGWDLTNRKNYSEKFREVIHEVSVEVEGHAKAADYAFQLGGKTLFFLEAKKPAVNIETNPEPAFQIRRYAWSAKLPISIVSDFEQMAVYDCRAKPVLGDPVHLGRVKLYSYLDYVEKWDDLYRLFSYQAVHQGSLDQFAVGLKGKRGTADVDDAFLVEMERWREELARNMALRNPSLTQHELNSAVQTTINRIIFLRICEERGIEAEDALRDATDGKEVYSDLLVLFKQADKKYNSGLFHFSTEKGQSSYPDTLTPTLKIDDRVFKDILANLYYPRSPYAFKYISADILGQVYERFLGKVIRLTAGHQAKVEEKPEVRKAGGVYYTPTYIVDYIVKNTVGELLKDKDPESFKTSPLRVLDPACGSGSFLLGAYQYLLDWYLDWYVQNDPARWAKGKKPPIFENRGGWQLSMEKKKDILTSHIFGVDIDAQAVEVTKLSLLLKVVENPGQLSLLGERILPDLGENIKCGNSLIGPDYYDNQQLTMFDSEEQYRVNAFDWHTAFPKVFASGGFDAVIGNPPYVRPHNLEPEDKKYFWRNYKTFVKKSDLYCCFIEKGISLLKPFGLFSYIVSDGWMRLDSFEELRKLLLDKTEVKTIIEFDDMVFDATVKTLIFVLSTQQKTDNVIKVSSCESKSKLFNLEYRDIVQDLFRKSYKNIFDLSIADQTEKIKQKMMNNSASLGHIFGLSFGLKTGDDKIFLSHKKTTDDHKPILRGANIHRYEYSFAGEYVWYVPIKMITHKKTARPGSTERFEQPKVLIRDTGGGLEGTFDNEHYYVKDVLVVTHPNYDILRLKLLCAILNSTLMRFYYETSFPTLHVQRDELASLPIKSYSNDPTDVARHDRMVALVETMLALHKQAARLPDEKERLQRQIQTTDRQIDKLVYELYGLTEDEIKIVEGVS